MTVKGVPNVLRPPPSADYREFFTTIFKIVRRGEGQNFRDPLYEPHSHQPQAFTESGTLRTLDQSINCSSTLKHLVNSIAGRH